jgi:hypothetical protein
MENTMKLDKIKFAKLVRYISGIQSQGDFDVEYLDDLIDVPTPVHNIKVDANDVNELLKQMINPDGGFINAIKAYRNLTGAGLKESKEAVEKYRTIPSFPHNPHKTDVHDGEERKEATLGDILHSAGRTKAGNNIC